MDNVKLIESLYRFFREKDYASFRAICHPELVWVQNPGFPGGATHHGPEQVVENVFKAFSDEWAEFRFTIDEILDAGDTVVVLGEYVGTHGHTGKAFTAQAAHVYRIEDGRLLSFRQYADTHVMRAAMG